MLHYSQELARRDVELSRLRKDKLNLEAEIRHLSILLEEASKKENDLKEALDHQLDRYNLLLNELILWVESVKNICIPIFYFILPVERCSQIQVRMYYGF